MGTLFKNDLMYLKKDPMIIICLCIPVVMLLAYQLILVRLSFLGNFLSYIKYLFVSMLTITSGMGIGFRVLDDKDENMLIFYSISPLGLKGYFCYRLIMSWIISLLGTILLIMNIALPIGFLEKVMIVLQVLVLTPLTMGILTILCKNKIQGLTFMKFSSLILVVPLLRALGENNLTKWLVLIPSDTLYRLIVEGRVEIGTYIVTLGVIVGVSLWIFKSKMKRVIAN